MAELLKGEEQGKISFAQLAIESAGYRVAGVQTIPEGQSHDNFRVQLKEGERRIARFEKPRIVEAADPLYGGHRSLAREAELMKLVREETELPTPQVYGLHEYEGQMFLFVQELPGRYWNEYMDQNNNLTTPFLESLNFLGAALAQIHSIHFPSFGNAMGRDEVEPAGVENFAHRLRLFTDLKVQAVNRVPEAFEQVEIDQVVNYLDERVSILEQKLANSPQQAILTLADVHPTNFFVDSQGKPSGFFDFELCQAATPAMEFYLLQTMFHYYNNQTAKLAVTAFLNGYRQAGGQYDPEDPINSAIEQILGVGYAFSTVASYKKFEGASDNFRHTWSVKFKEVLFDAIRNGEMDYQAVADILRDKTGQPEHPSDSRLTITD